MHRITIKDFTVLNNEVGQSLIICDRFLQIQAAKNTESQGVSGIISIEDDMQIDIYVEPGAIPAAARKRFPNGLHYTFISEKDILSPDIDHLLLFWQSAHHSYTVTVPTTFGFREE